MMFTVVTDGNWSGWGKAEGGKSVHSQQAERCRYTYSLCVKYNYMYILTCVRTYRHVVIKWSTDRLHSSSSDKKSSAVLHMVWVMLRMCSRIEQLWAMLCTGLTASASSFLLLSPFSNTLVDVHPFLRSEVIYTGRGEGRVCCNATHTTLSRTTLTSCLEGLRGGALCH